MSNEELQRRVAAFKVLADESRLRILGILATGPRSGGELADLVNLRASTISHHLTRLRESGLVTVEKLGTTRRYSLNRDALEALRSTALAPDRMAQVVPEATQDAYTRKVFSAFLDQGHLTRIPASRKKRDVILQWLAEHFELDQELSEAAVNERILSIHWDSATLRRELVGGGWMQRTDGRYTRVR